MANKKEQWKTKTSEGFEVSTANQELVTFDDDRTVRLYKRMTIYVDKPCMMTRNGNEKIYVLPISGYILDENNTATESLVIQEEGVTFYYSADY